MGFPTESTAPSSAPFTGFNPRNFRDVIQRQIKHNVNQQVDAVTNLSIGDFDGRFLGNFPGTVQQLQDTDGVPYHVVGFNVAGDTSVAAP
jgi:hypothetical protein